MINVTQEEILKIKLKDDDVDNDDLEVLLQSAKLIILSNRYPYHEFPIDENGEYILEDRYKDLQIRIAVELFAKAGAEGELTHTENGTTRQWASADVSPALLKEIIPKAKVF